MLYQVADSLQASQSGLEQIDGQRRLKGWNKDAAVWLDAASQYCGTISRATLQRFWAGKPVRRDNFVAICKAVGIEDWREIVNSTVFTSSSSVKERVEFFAYDDFWVGRTQTLAELKQQVEENSRVLILVGMTGIGKTALAERLVVELKETWLQDDWNNFLQENFEDESQSPDFGSVAARWLEKWGELVTPDDRKDTQRLLYRLIRHLRENQRLVLMDSVEKILQGNEEEGWNDFKDEWWVKFFKGLLAAESCQSCILITSQDLPQQIEAEGNRFRNFWYRQFLRGLDADEQLALFEKTGLEVTIEAEGRSYLERIGRAYEGHPLALRIIAGEIGNRPFFGNVVAYWKQHGHEIEEIEKAIEEAKTGGPTASAEDPWHLHRYSRELRKNVKLRLGRTFDRLRQDIQSAYFLVCATSVYRCPVPQRFWLSHLEDWEYEQEAREVALDVLRDRYLVEEVIEDDQLLLRQHNLIRSLALERLKQLDEE